MTNIIFVNKLFPAVLAFYHLLPTQLLVPDPGACIALGHLPPFAKLKQHIILHINFDTKITHCQPIQNLTFPEACTVEMNCLMTCILSDLAVN